MTRLAGLLPVAGGTAYALGNVGWGFWPLAMVALVPLWYAILGRGHRPRRGVFVTGLLFGGAAYVVGFGWLFRLAGHFIDSVGGALLLWSAYGLWFAVLFGAYAVSGRWLVRRGCPWWVGLTAPLILLEAFQASLFPSHVGAGLVHQPYLAQLASLGGPLLLSALVVLVNGCVFSGLLGAGRPRVASLGLGLFLLALAAFHGALQLREESPIAPEGWVRVGIVQNNVVSASGEANSKAALHRKGHERNMALSRELLKKQPVDLLVWPESAYRRALRRPLPLDAQTIRRDIDVPLLFGASSSFHHEGRAATGNSVFLSDWAGRIEQVYDKQLLLPFAETAPGAGLLASLSGLLPPAALRQWRDRYHAWLDRHFPWRQGFVPGPGRGVIAVDDTRIATPVCFEMIHPGYVRRMVRDGAANIVVTVANDAWFGDSQAPWMHLAMARLRAIEHGLWVVRATNSGVSAFIDPRGRVVGQTRLFEEAVLSAQVQARNAGTVYSRLGDWVALFAAGVLVVTVALARGRKDLRTVALVARG